MRTSNPMERSIQQEIKRRMNVVKFLCRKSGHEKWETTEKPYITWKAEDD